MRQIILFLLILLSLHSWLLFLALWGIITRKLVTAAVSAVVGIGSVYPLIQMKAAPFAQSEETVDKLRVDNFDPILDVRITTFWDDNWDRRSPINLIHPTKILECNEDESCIKELTKDKRPTATRHLFFVRHGQYVLHADDRDQKVLTELGHKQAEATAERLQSLGFDFDVVVSSELVRAKQTADAVQRCQPAATITRKYDLMLNEGCPCMPEPPFSDWRTSMAVLHEDGARIEAAFRKYVHRAPVSQKKDSYEIIVCHGNVIRYFVLRALQLPPEGWLRISLANGSITHMVIRPSGRVGIRCIGESGFMPPDWVTYM